MYNNKLVASIKANGRILRENKDTVYIPFGSEYSILLKNLNTVRAVINVFIDGENQVPGGLVLNPSQEIDLERSIKNNNLLEGNRFKFIERTSAIENYRGIKSEDGLVRIEYQFEMPKINQWKTDHNYDYFNKDKPYWLTSSKIVNRRIDVSNGDSTRFEATSAVNHYCSTNNITAQASAHDGNVSMDWCDVGITVPGSKSEQRFQTTTVQGLDPVKHNIVLRLLGQHAEQPVKEPITVKHKPKCQTCGTLNRATAKFCSDCGTALEVFV